MLTSAVRGLRGAAAFQPLRRGVAALSTAAVPNSKSRVTAVLGAQWGDEGKGKLADILAADYDIVARFNGGANAGHTVIVGKKKYAFHMLPCGLVHDHTVNVLGNGCVIDFDAIFDELAPLEADGVDWKNRLLISNRAHILFDIFKTIDGAAEDKKTTSGQQIGTTRKGIGPAYTSKASRSGVRVGEMRNRGQFIERVRMLTQDLAEQHHLDFDVQGAVDKFDDIAGRVQDMIADTSLYVNQAYASGKRIIAEGANAAMLDLDHGTYPYVTSSTTIAGGVGNGLGLPASKVDTRIGVVKAYTTRVGAGPFPTELTDDRGGGNRPHKAPGSDIGLHLQTVGAEIGVTTKRKRRCGWLDVPLLHYSHMINDFTGINITKLDILDELEEIQIGVAYSINGQELPRGAMPATLSDLAAVDVVYETLPGWKTSISNCTSYEQLPDQAKTYIRRVEELVGVPVQWVGVGPARDNMIRVPARV